MCVSSVLFQTHRHTWMHAQKLIRFHCCLPRSLALANPPDFASHHDGSGGHLSPSPWPVARGGLTLPPPGSLAACRRRGLPAGHLQFGSIAEGLVPNKPPKSADVLKAADTDGSALILPFSPAAREKRERKRNKGRD